MFSNPVFYQALVDGQLLKNIAMKSDLSVLTDSRLCTQIHGTGGFLKTAFLTTVGRIKEEKEAEVGQGSRKEKKKKRN